MISKEISRSLYEYLKDVRNQTIKDFIEPPNLLNEDVTISKIIGVMTNKNIHEVFIQHKDKSISCVNTRDVLSTRDINTAKSSTIGRIPSLNEDDSIGDAARIMSLHRLRSLPVIDKNNHLVTGQISSQSIIKCIYDTFSRKKMTFESKITVSDIMTQDVITISPKDKLATAKSIMVKHFIDHLPIAEKNPDDSLTMKGMITSADIMQTLIPSERIGRDVVGIEDSLQRSELEISGFSDKDKNLTTIDPGDTITSLMDLLLRTNSTYAIVKSHEHILGIATFRDIIGLLGEQIESEVPIYIIGMPKDPFESELVKSKFTTIIKLLTRISPEIEEARCKIKVKDIQGESRGRYEVSSNIITPYRRYTYVSSHNVWDLAKIFDEMSDSLKNQLSRKRHERQKDSVRHSYEEIS